MPDTHLAAVSPPFGLPSLPCVSDAAVLAEVVDIARQVLEDRTIALGMATRIDDVAGCDSMSIIAIIVEAECRFDLLFTLEELEEVLTVGHLVRLIQAKQSLRERVGG